MAIETLDEEKQVQQSVDDAHSDEVDHVVQETKAMKMTDKVLNEQEEPLDFSSKKTSAGVADEGQTHWNHSPTSVFSQTSRKTPPETESLDSDVCDSGSRRRERSPNCSMTSEGGRLGSSRLQSMHSANAGYEAAGGSVTGNALARSAEVHQPIEDGRQSKRTSRHSTSASRSVQRAHEENNEMSLSGHTRRSGDDYVSDGNNENVIDSRQINRRAIHQLSLLQATAGLGASNGCSPPEVAGYGDNGYDFYNYLLDRHSAMVNGGARPNRTLNSFNPAQSMGQQPVLHHNVQRYPSLPSTVDSTAATPNMSNSVRQLPIHDGHNDSRAQLRQRLTLENLFFQHQQLRQQQELLQQQRQQQQELLQHQQQLQHRERNAELHGDGRRSRRCLEATVGRPAIENTGIRPNCTAFPGNYRSPRALDFNFDCVQSSQDDSGGRNEMRVSPGTPNCSSTSCSPNAFVDNQAQQTVYNHNDFRPSAIANVPNPLVSSSFPSPSTARSFTNNIPAAAASSAAASPPSDVVSRPASNSSSSMDTTSSHSSSHLGDGATATSSGSPAESVSSVQRSTNGSRGSYERQNSTGSSVTVSRSNSRTATPTIMTTEMRNNGQNGRKRGRSLPEELKNAEYWERRRKNNEAAKRSRDARRAKEDEIAHRAAFLERENRELRVEVDALKRETSELRYLLYASPELRPRIV